MPFERRKAGEPDPGPSATEHNAFIEAALAHRARAGGLTAATPGPLNHNMVLVQNDTGSDRSAFDVVALDDAVGDIDLDSELAAVSAVEPDPENQPTHRSRIAILADGIKYGDSGLAYVAGQLTCRVDIVNPNHPRARVIDGYKLQSGFFGPVRILRADAASDWTRVLIDGYDGGHCLAKLPAGGIDAGTWGVPSITECELFWAGFDAGKPQAIPSPHLNTINVYHFGGAIDAAKEYVRCRLECGRIIPDVEYC